MKTGNLILKMGFKKRAKDELKRIVFFVDIEKDTIKFNFTGAKKEHKGTEKYSSEEKYELMLAEHTAALDLKEGEKITHLHCVINYETKLTEGSIYYVNAEGEKKIYQYKHKI